jgi:hypothetical protein
MGRDYEIEYMNIVEAPFVEQLDLDDIWINFGSNDSRDGISHCCENN